MNNTKNSGLILLISCVLLSSCSVLIPKILPFNNIPAPTGFYSVGTQIFDWEDTNREEWFTENPEDFRKIVVQVWYPAEKIDGYPAPYLDFAQRRIKPISEQVELPPFMINHIQEVKSNSYLNAPIKTAIESYPLIIFSHGLGGMRMQNTIQMEELASRGFIAIAMDHPFDANVTFFNDGSKADFRSAYVGDINPDNFWKIRLPQINTRAADVSFILDTIQEYQDQNEEFWSLIDLERVGVMGHSFGGGTAIVASSKDPRLDACVALDGWLVPIEKSIIKKGLNVPFLYMGRSYWDNPVNYENLDTLIAASTGKVEKLILDGTKHFDYSDTPQFSTASRRFGISGSIDINELRHLLNNQIVTFFKNNL